MSRVLKFVSLLIFKKKYLDLEIEVTLDFLKYMIHWPLQVRDRRHQKPSGTVQYWGRKGGEGFAKVLNRKRGGVGGRS